MWWWSRPGRGCGGCRGYGGRGYGGRGYGGYRGYGGCRGGFRWW